MNDWQKIFNTLKEIEPDPVWSKRSRTQILLTEPRAKSWISFDISKTLTQSTELAAGMVLAGCLLFLLIGGSSISHLFGPFRLASLDPASLKAEAQAIDIQIQLADLSYNPDQIGAQPVLINNISANPNKSAKKPAETINKNNSSGSGDAGNKSEDSSNETSTPLSIDGALDILSGEPNI